MKKLYKLLISLLIILILLLCSGSVYAIDETLDELPTSETGDYYEEKIKPLLIVAISSACGSGTGLISFIIIIWKAFKANKKAQDEQKAFIEAVATKLGLTKDQIDLVKGNYETILNKVDEVINTKVIPLTDEVKRLSELFLKSLEESQSLKDFITNSLTITNTNDDRIIKILQIAFLNNPELVKNGFATEIRKV
jgi:hypothetical protein